MGGTAELLGRCFAGVEGEGVLRHFWGAWPSIGNDLWRLRMCEGFLSCVYDCERSSRGRLIGRRDRVWLLVLSFFVFPVLSCRA